jgi:hypothetical protein
MLFFLAGKCDVPPHGWERLCPDVRRLILSNMPDHHLALAASTCREFGDECRRRVQEVRTTATSVAKETYGKMLPGFLRAVRRSVHGQNPGPGLLRTGRSTLIIDHAGKRKLLRNQELSKRHSDNYTTYIQRWSYSSGIIANLGPRHAMSGKMASLTVFADRDSHGSVELEAVFNKQAAVAVLGVLLGICMQYRKTRRACRRAVPLLICVSVDGLPDDRAGQGEMRKLFDPLKSLAKRLMYG